MENKNNSLNVTFKMLHISDLHITGETDPINLLEPLLNDLKRKKDVFYFEKMDCVVISGDITSRGTKEEFDIANIFIKNLLDRIGVSPKRCVVVPGNHDIDWSTNVYDYKDKDQVGKNVLVNGSYITAGEGYLVRNDKRYFDRFDNFMNFYKEVTGIDYPVSCTEDSVIYPIDEFGIRILAFNSCWEIDKYFPNRASINTSALSNCLMMVSEMDNENQKNNKIKCNLNIAVMHHPVTGNDKIEDTVFLNRFSSGNVRLLLNGHVHEKRDDVLRHYDKDKMICIAGTGTFGAKTKERPPSTPCLYSVIEIENNKKIKVYTREMQTTGSAWDAFAHWPGTKATDKTFFYVQEL